MKVKIKKLFEDAILPTYGSSGAAGADLYAYIPDESASGKDSDGNNMVAIPPNATVMIHTGVAVEIPKGYVGLICARSGKATKEGLAPANKIGVIDRDYRGELMVAEHNHNTPHNGDSAVEFSGTVKHGERIAQLVIVPYEKAEWDVVDELDKTDRAEGGFGSTGK